MTSKIKLFLLVLICMSSGCAKMMPYGDTYDCPQTEKGQCVSVEAAYEYALVGATPGSGNAESVSASREALGDAIEKYRKAVVKGEAAEIEQRQNELLRIVNPGQANEFGQALEQFKEAVKASKPNKISEAEQHLHEIHARAVANAKDTARLEYNITSEATRQEFLGRYAQGQKTQAVLLPPVIMETHILPYQTAFNTLAGERTMWIPVEPSRWTWPDKFNSGKGEEIGSTVRGGE
jgi:hypothetical protein